MEIECVYDATRDKRRKIHWERTETEAGLQKELLQRLFELIRVGDGEVSRLLQDDADVARLAQRLGFTVPEYAAQTWPYARATSGGEVEDDVSQRSELQKRGALHSQADDRMETEPGTVRSTRTDSSGQSNIPTFSEPGMSDARNQYRIFCSRDHAIPSIESIRVFGELPFPPTEISTNYGSIKLHQQQILDLRIPEYLIQPLLFDEERCPMAAVYTDFRDYGRRQIADGQSIDTVLGSTKVDVGLYLRERKPGDPHTPATWACEFMRLLNDFDTYVALAFIFTHARFMRVSIEIIKVIRGDTANDII